MKPNRAVPQGLTFIAGPILLLAVLTVVALAARPLTPIDETRYVGVAWEMWLKGDYLVLFKNGEPYSHKPPLLFWLYNLGWAVTGVNEWWPRLVSPLFALGAMALTLSISRRLWPDDLDTGRNALWIQASCLLWMLFSTSAMFDVMLAFFALLGMRGLLIAANESMKRGFAWLALAIGLGVLAKGPVILLHVLPVALLAPWWRPGMNLKRWHGGVLLAVLGGAAIALAWAIPAALRGGEEYQRMIFWGQTANRMVDSFAHKRAFWWYLPLLPLLFFPWLLWPALWRQLGALRKTGLDHGLRFCLSWLAPVFVFFSLISGKQIHYLVPLVPAFALIAGHVLRDAKPHGLALPALLAGAAGLGMAYAGLAGLPDKPGMWQGFSWWPGALLMLAALLAGWSGRRENMRMPGLALLGAALYAATLLTLSDNLLRRYDVHPLAEQLSELQERGIPVANNGFYHGQFQFAGRLKKPIDELLSPAEIAPWFAKNPGGMVIIYDDPQPGESAPVFMQPYLGEHAMLMNAEQAGKRGLLREGLVPQADKPKPVK